MRSTLSDKWKNNSWTEKSVCINIPKHELLVQSLTIYLFLVIDASTLIQISHTHLPEAIYHDADEISSRTQAAPASASAIKQDHDMNDAHDDSIPTLDEDESKLQSHSHILPLSPTTSESSGPHSPRSGGFGSYPLGMPPPTVHVIPPESPTAPKSMHDPSYMSGYYAQPFMPDKSQGFWPHASPVSQYGY
jgi:hypothetical protein